MDKNIHSRTIHISQELSAAHMFSYRRMDKLWYIHMVECSTRMRIQSKPVNSLNTIDESHKKHTKWEISDMKKKYRIYMYILIES